MPKHDETIHTPADEGRMAFLQWQMGIRHPMATHNPHHPATTGSRMWETAWLEEFNDTMAYCHTVDRVLRK